MSSTRPAEVRSPPTDRVSDIGPAVGLVLETGLRSGKWGRMGRLWQPRTRLDLGPSRHIPGRARLRKPLPLRDRFHMATGLSVVSADVPVLRLWICEGWRKAKNPGLRSGRGSGGRRQRAAERLRSWRPRLGTIGGATGKQHRAAGPASARREHGPRPLVADDAERRWHSFGLMCCAVGHGRSAPVQGHAQRGAALRPCIW